MMYVKPHRSRRSSKSSISLLVGPTRAKGDCSTICCSTPSIEAIPEAACFASSVMLTKNARTFISMSLKRAPAASRTMATFSSTASAVMVLKVCRPTTPADIVALMPTMSASRAAIDNTRLPPPPIRIGGHGAWMGLGVPS